MRDRKSVALRLEPLESREVPSATPAPFVGPLPTAGFNAAPAVVSPFVAPITGSLTAHFIEATSGSTTSVSLTGTGKLTPLGLVNLSGSVTNSGTGATGTITLSSNSGSVTLSLTPYITGPLRPVGEGPVIPDAYVYSVASATGTFSGLTGRGEVTLGLGTATAGNDTVTFSNLSRIQPL